MRFIIADQLCCGPGKYVSRFGSDNARAIIENPRLMPFISDPDAIRVGDYYYLIAFHALICSGLPILLQRSSWPGASSAHAFIANSFDHFSATLHAMVFGAPLYVYTTRILYLLSRSWLWNLSHQAQNFGPLVRSRVVQYGRVLDRSLSALGWLWKCLLVHAICTSCGINLCLVVKKWILQEQRRRINGVLVLWLPETDPTIEVEDLKRIHPITFLLRLVWTRWAVVIASNIIYGP